LDCHRILEFPTPPLLILWLTPAVGLKKLVIS